MIYCACNVFTQPTIQTTNQKTEHHKTIPQQRNTRLKPTKRIPIKSPHSKSISWNILDFQILQNFYLVKNLVSTGKTQTDSCRRALWVQYSIIFKPCHVSNWNYWPNKNYQSKISDWVTNTLQCSCISFSPRCQLYEPNEFKDNAAVSPQSKVQNPDFSLLWPFFFYHKCTGCFF